MLVASEAAGLETLLILVIAGQAPPVIQLVEQSLAVFLRQYFVQCTLVGGLGQQLRGVAVDVGQHFPYPLWLALKSVLRVHIGVVVELDEGF